MLKQEEIVIRATRKSENRFIRMGTKPYVLVQFKREKKKSENDANNECSRTLAINITKQPTKKKTLHF